MPCLKGLVELNNTTFFGIQVNADINLTGEVTRIGVVTQKFWLLVNKKVGIDFEWNPKAVQPGLNGQHGLLVNMVDMRVRIQSNNTMVGIQLLPSGSIRLEIDILKRHATDVNT
jgi:hypothetical protein